MLFALNRQGDPGDMGLILGSGRSPGIGNGNLFQYFLPGKSHGQRILVGSSPWGCKKSDMIEHACMLLKLTSGYKGKITLV